jgi:hypothetical protein
MQYLSITVAQQLVTDRRTAYEAAAARRGRRSRLRLDHDPAAPLKLGRELRRGDSPQRLLDSRETRRRRDRSVSIGGGAGLLQLLDERVGLVTRELAAGLPLREVHGPARVAEVDVPCLLEQAE